MCSSMAILMLFRQDIVFKTLFCGDRVNAGGHMTCLFGWLIGVRYVLMSSKGETQRKGGKCLISDDMCTGKTKYK